MADTGVSILRVPLSWDQAQAEAGDCEPAPKVGVCDWSFFDEIVGQAASNGIRIFPTLAGRPAFTLDETTDEDRIREHPPTTGPGLEAWQDFTEAAAARYGDDGEFWKELSDAFGTKPVPIEEWQVWNEQNAASYWPPEPDAAEYAGLVQDTAEAIHRADPEAEVVLGGMFGEATVPATDYLRELYGVEGASEAFDSIAIHPYAADVEGVESQTEALRDVAIEAGDENVGLWVTELGWGSGNGDHPLEVGEEEQASLLDGTFRLYLDEREPWNVEGVSWFTWEDRDDDTVCRFCRTAGLLDADGEPKPSWDVFKSYAQAE